MEPFHDDSSLKKLNKQTFKSPDIWKLKNRERLARGSCQLLSFDLTFDQWRMALERAQYAEMKHKIPPWHSSLSGRASVNSPLPTDGYS